ncbi:MAG TPA: ATP-binding protein [Pilimelia sp.]|nr:ATP-binding protein [Pilimelia sp.]
MTADDGTLTALDNLRDRLTQLHRERGEPSVRDLSRKTRHAISHTTVWTVIKCAKAPRWYHLELLVEALGGGTEEFRELWVAARNAEDSGVEAVDRSRDTVVNMARRGQVVVDRIMEHLTLMQHGGPHGHRREDVTVLARLAVRMRRYNENMLLLMGVDSGRVRHEPVEIMNVVRAALSESGSSSRVGVGQLDDGIAVVPTAADHVIRLLAELLDNAVEFSPPATVVSIDATWRDAAVVVRIEDDGIGIPTRIVAAFADQLADVSKDWGSARMMGLNVVARLAARHRIGVELRPTSSGGGTVALVTLPPDVIVREKPAAAAIQRVRLPDQTHRSIVAHLPRQHLDKLVDLLSPEQTRVVLAGLAAERATAVLDRTRPPGWPTATEPPVRRPRPGLPPTTPE